MAPPKGELWEVNVQVLIDNESFQFQLCSLAWVGSAIVGGRCLMTGRRAIVEEYSYAILRDAIDRVILECEYPDYAQFARGLNWYMQWEFENFAEHRS